MGTFLYLPQLKLYLYIRIRVLHPRHKLAYFKNAGWDQTWIDTAKNLVCDQFESRYASHTDTAMENDSSKDTAEAQKESPKVRHILYCSYASVF